VKSAIVTVFITDLGVLVFRYAVPSGLFTVSSVPSNSYTLTLPLLNIATYCSFASLLIVCIWTLPSVELDKLVTNCKPDRFVRPKTGLLSALSCISAWSGCFIRSAACETPLNKVGIALETTVIII